ncbi:SAV_2336 N-terminal domain-related protein [Streptomyces sp. NRRL S-1868]|uniref:SAV_2336 N-terminal domain-related protein n=1 Tax=Streptomyces sp. NRRL S-1868 TaxID=1463892 RepID=UPI0022771883|nr:SAV_2336 N-terminal domain-related protein [Streptomyces sp. NRRL S-1868]
MHRAVPHLDATAISEALWLAAQFDASPGKAPKIGGQGQGGNTPAVPMRGKVPSAASPTPFTSPVPSAEKRPLHELLPGSDTAVGGQTVSSPRATALPEALELAQALRPWKKNWNSGHHLVLDVAETVENYGRSGDLLPAFTPAAERWFDLDIIVDLSPSMQVWKETIDSFAKVLDGLGAFRSRRILYLSFSGKSQVKLHDRQGCPVRAGRLKSPDSRRLVMLISDCATRAWRHRAIWQQVREWSESTPFAILNPLPTKLWRRTGLNLPTVQVFPTTPGANSPKLTHEPPPLLSRDAGTWNAWRPVPVLSLSPHSLSRWSRAVMLGSPHGCAAVLVPPTGRPVPRVVPEREYQRSPQTPVERTEKFLRIASPAAAQLAILCSPFDRLGLGLLHLIRQELVSEANTGDIAELLTSGVFFLETAQDGSVELVVPQSVQARLRQELPEFHMWRIHRALSRFISAHSTSYGSLVAVARGSSDSEELPASLIPFSHASQRTLELLGLSPSVSGSAGLSSPTTVIPGQLTTRAEMKKLFGGGLQGGITPSTTTPNILIYSDHASGHRYGYYDGWLPENDEYGPLFEYTGAGTVGDQTFTGRAGANNKAILHHAENGRALRVFMADGKVRGSATKYQRYIGEFALDQRVPYITRRAPDDNGELRNVIVFRLRPIGDFVRNGKDEIPPAAGRLGSATT